MKEFCKGADEVAKGLGCDLKKGLNEESVRKNRELFGENVISQKKKKSFIKRLIEALSEPSLLILEFAWAVTVGVNIGKELKSGNGEFLECVGIMLAVLLSAFLTLYMEGKSQRAFEALGKLYGKTSVKVIRSGEERIISKEEIVCGDLVLLEAGDKVVADGRVIRADGLTVDESTLTGESQAVEKNSSVIRRESVPLADRKNMVYSGTFISSGRGVMIVTAVGDGAELGKIAVNLSGKQASAPLNEKLNKLGKTVTVIGGLSAGIVFLLSIVRLAILKDISFFTVQDAFLEAIVLIVAAVPEGLPATAAISLSLNVVRLAKSNALIRKLVAAETSGCVSVICSDKTGTLTQNKMRVERVVDYKGAKQRIAINSLVNSTAKIDFKKGVTYGSATEGAMLFWCEKQGYKLEKTANKELIGRVMPFSSKNKFMATEYFGEQRTVYFKGAPEIIVSDCNLSYVQKKAVLDEVQRYQSEGKRVIAFSSCLSGWNGNELTGGEATFDGFAVISDPVRKGVKESVKSCKDAGIEVIMMTGDNSSTAYAIGRELGIAFDVNDVVNADQIDRLSDGELAKNIKRYKIIARSTPTTKLRIVNALRSRGEVVAVTGDGVNDAPAIESADLGVAMGSGSEITKEASDVVLLDDSFSTIVKAVSFGRNVYRNFQRFITFQLTVNITAMIVVVVSLALGMINPFSSVQLLWIDIIMDGPPALTLAMEADNGKLLRAKPVKRTDGIVTKTMFLRILFQGVFMAITVLYQYFYDFLGVGRERVSTSVFCMFVIFQLFNAFNCRKLGSESIFTGLYDNKAMLGVFGVAFLVQIVITQLLCGFFATVPLDFVSWLKIILVCLSTVAFSEIYKLFYRIFKVKNKIKLKNAQKLN